MKPHPESDLKTHNCCEVAGILTPTHVLLFTLLCKSSTLMLISGMCIQKKKCGLTETGVLTHASLVWYFILIIKLSFCRCVQNRHLAFLFQDAVAQHTTLFNSSCFSLLYVHLSPLNRQLIVSLRGRNEID